MSLLSCIKSLIKRAKTTLPGNDTGVVMTAQVQYMNKVATSHIINPAGFGHNPTPNNLAIIFNVSGVEDNLSAIVTNDLNRIKNLLPGETVIYNTETNANIFFDSLGNINVNPGIPIGSFNINFPLTEFFGDVIFNLPPNEVMISGSSPAYSIGLDDGQVLIGATALAPVAATLTAGTNIAIVNLPGSITISTTGFGTMAFQNSDDVNITGGDITGLDSLQVDAFSTAGVVHNDATGLFSSSLIVNDDVDASAAIVDTKLATISTAGKVANSATTGTNANTPNTLVLRDGSGDFDAGNVYATGLSLDGLSFLTGILKQDSFTPTMFDSSGNQPAYTTQLGKYLRVGNTVFIDLTVTISSKVGVTSGDDIWIGNLPYVVGTGFNTVGTILPGNSDFTGPLLSVSLRVRAVNGQSYLDLTWINNTGMTSMATWSQFSSTGSITISINYTV